MKFSTSSEEELNGPFDSILRLVIAAAQITASAGGRWLVLTQTNDDGALRGAVWRQNNVAGVISAGIETQVNPVEQSSL